MDRKCTCLKTHSKTKYGVTAKFKKGETYLYCDSGSHVTVYSNESADYNQNSWDTNGYSKFERYFDSELKYERKSKFRFSIVGYFFEKFTDLPKDEIMGKIIFQLLDETFPNKTGSASEIMNKLTDSKDVMLLQYNRITKLKHLKNVSDSGKYEE